MTDFIERALVFIGSAVLLVPVFQRLGFGSVLGYLIAGVVVGPYGLQFISDSQSILHFSELGVVFLLFIIGLEIQPHKLWSMRQHLFRLGGLQVALSSLLFMSLGYAFGLSATSAAVVGFALSLSSTAFAVQYLTEKNQFNTEFGRSSFAILLAQDLMAIPALAIIPALGVASTASPVAARSPWFALGFMALLVLASRFLLRPLFRVIGRTRSREVFTAATLFIVLGVAAVMLKLGLSAALGTFLAGVLLADSEYRHELEANLEPFKSLLMGLFFIAVGMTVSLNIIASRPSVVFSMAVGYLVCKAFVVYLVTRLFRMSHQNAKQSALSVAQGGEFAFVIFGIVAQAGLAASSTVELLTAVITLSMALNPLFTLLNERLSKLKTVAPIYDQMQDESPDVIIAGFGRFGQMFARILRAQSVPFVAIDHDADQIELARRFGNKVYYGDASRIDLLEAAGAARARYLVLAIDGVETSVEMAKTVKDHFPNLKIFARARNRGHAFDLMTLGISHIKRETFDSSVYFVRDLLVDMGYPAEKAFQMIERFKRHDELMLVEQFKARGDDKKFISVSQQATAQLAQVLNADETTTYVGYATPPNH